MIEAVNSVISNAQLARVSTDQIATADSFAADVNAVESVARAPVAPYISPYIAVDARFDTAVLQIRDSDTGDVLNQFPSESRLRQAAQREAAQAAAERLSSVRSSAPQAPQAAPTPSETTFQVSSITQESVQPASSTAGAAQAAIAALSAGAQSGLATSTVSVTA